MGIIRPLNRKQLINQHIASMRSWAIILHNRWWPWISKTEVVKRLESCADHMERAHSFMCEKEARIERGEMPL